MSICTGTPPVNTLEWSGTCHHEDLVGPDTVGRTDGIDLDDAGREIPKQKRVMECHLNS
jgi:hypothetical protein